MTTRLTVHIRVTDESTGLIAPCRLRVTGPGDEYLAPYGRNIDFPIGRNEAVGGNLYYHGKKFAYIDGSCEIQLPTETPLKFEIFRGPDTIPIQETITLGKGQISVRFRLQHAMKLQTGKWQRVDGRALFLTPHAADLEQKAEGMDGVNLLATVHYYPSADGHLYPTVPNLLAFSGQVAAYQNIVVNTFNTHYTLGRLALLNCHRIIFPISFGGDDNDDWSLGAWCSQCHRKQGLVIWADAFRKETGLLGGEGLLALILGEVDALEFDARERHPPLLPVWYRLLNAGFRIPIIGGSGKDSNRTPVGAMHTYCPESDSYRDWIETIRRGYCTVTNGPRLDLWVDGQPPGTSVAADPVRPLKIRTVAISMEPFDRLQIIANGEVVAESSYDSSGQSILELEYLMPLGGWLAARCLADSVSSQRLDTAIFAHTSVIEIQPEFGSRWILPSSIPYFRSSIEETRRWVLEQGRYTTVHSQELILNRCLQADQILSDREHQSNFMPTKVDS